MPQSASEHQYTGVAVGDNRPGLPCRSAGPGANSRPDGRSHNGSGEHGDRLPADCHQLAAFIPQSRAAVHVALGGELGFSKILPPLLAAAVRGAGHELDRPGHGAGGCRRAQHRQHGRRPGIHQRDQVAMIDSVARAKLAHPATDIAFFRTGKRKAAVRPAHIVVLQELRRDALDHRQLHRCLRRSEGRCRTFVDVDGRFARRAEARQQHRYHLSILDGATLALGNGFSLPENFRLALQRTIARRRDKVDRRRTQRHALPDFLLERAIQQRGHQATVQCPPLHPAGGDIDMAIGGEGGGDLVQGHGYSGIRD